MKISVKSSRRIVVAELHCAGHKSLGIIKEMGYDAGTVDRTVASLKQGNGIQRKTHSLRNHKKRTKRFLSGLKQGNCILRKIHSLGSDKKRIKRFFGGLKQGNGIQRKTYSPRSDKKRTKRFLVGLKLSIAPDLFELAAKLERKRNVSKVTISKAVRNDLTMKSYCRRRRNTLTAKSKAIAKKEA